MELNGNLNGYRLLFGYLEEINVEEDLLNGVELSLLDDGLVLRSIDVDAYQIDVRRVDDLVDFLLVYYEVSCNGQTVFVTLFSVHHAGYEAVLANFLGGLLAEVSANATIDRKFSHCFF